MGVWNVNRPSHLKEDVLISASFPEKIRGRLDNKSDVMISLNVHHLRGTESFSVELLTFHDAVHVDKYQRVLYMDLRALYLNSTDLWPSFNNAFTHTLGCVEKHFFSSDQFETPRELSLGMDY